MEESSRNFGAVLDLNVVGRSIRWRNGFGLGALNAVRGLTGLSFVRWRGWTLRYVILKLGTSRPSPSRDGISGSSTLEGEEVVWLGDRLVSTAGGAILMFKGFGTSEWRTTTSVILGAIGEVERGCSSLSRNGSDLGGTAGLIRLGFRALTKTSGALSIGCRLSGIDVMLAAGGFRLGFGTGVSRFATPSSYWDRSGVATVTAGERELLHSSSLETFLVLATGGKYLRMSFWPCLAFAIGLRYTSMVG